MAAYVQWISLIASSLLLQRIPIASDPPTVTLDGATFQGSTNTSTGITRFLGIPFAKPPTGDLRFRLPVPFEYTEGTFNATNFGLSCPQQAIRLPIPSRLPNESVTYMEDYTLKDEPTDSEDCLTINVVKPATIPAGKKLPVVAWIYGGGFEFGGSSSSDGGVIVQKSVNMSQPVIYVSMNYRVSLFGFLASQEVKDAGVGNLGLHDQREALRWIQKYIGEFGGDPSKVTMWGQSSGAISVALQLLTNGGDTEGLYRAAFMQSGAPIPVGDITDGQRYYDAVVEEVGCSSEPDTLECLRTVDYAALYTAMNKSPNILSYQSLILAWLPRADGVFLTDNPQKLVADGSVANIPIITGNCDDEGTLFSLSTLNITTEDELREYLKTIYLPDATDDDITQLLEAYPANVTQGSPYDTGNFNALTPQYKRLASFQGDAVFQAPRRYFLNQLAELGRKDIWVFLSKRFKFLPFLGSIHGSDLRNVYGTGEMQNYLISFANTLNPNYNSGFLWPQWTPKARRLLIFRGGLLAPIAWGKDTYREESMNFLTDLMLKYPI